MVFSSKMEKKGKNRACLVVFLKAIFYSKKKNKGNRENTFSSIFFFFEKLRKDKKTLNSVNKNSFQKTQKLYSQSF